MYSDLPLYLFHQGTNFNAYEYLGAHFEVRNKEKGVVFRVWAPAAKKVSVVGDFNDWNISSHEMERIDKDGVYELFIPNLKEFDSYKYYIVGKKNKGVYKADPYAFHSETPPQNASKVYNLEGYNWKDGEFISRRSDNSLNKPMNVYEVNLASWKRHSDGSYFSYLEYSDELVKYVLDFGYTHVEFMPVSEYPFDGSWGYQVTGYYSVSSRFGTPKDFMTLVDKLHQAGIYVIIDWVPAHFPKDEFGLIDFDGGPLYENHGKDRMENANWGTRLYDYGRTEVQSFLISNVIFFFEKFHIDGVRVDAVASMLYLDYDKKPGEWTPNVYGNNKNLDAIAFFHKLNKEVFTRFPYALMIAEESTADVKITGRIEDGALGFNYKWNMGWMNDILSYMKCDPLFRHYDHNKLTFSMCYAFSENFVLPISHDEVVHGKQSLLDKMPGNYEDKFANNRAFIGYMMSHPGKKLSFMGEEFGQFKEWNYEEGIEMFMTVYPLHYKLSLLYKDINHIYKEHDALYSIDDGWGGFEWLDVNNNENNIVSFYRKGLSGEKIISIVSFNGLDLKDYKLRVDEKDFEVLICSDNKKYGGNGSFSKKVIHGKRIKGEGKPYEISLDVPRLSFIYLVVKN